MNLHEMMDFVTVEKGNAMAEYIACRRCDSPDCKGCNLKRLETMLENGKFDCLMNENRCINSSFDVAPVKHGRWIEYTKVIIPEPYNKWEQAWKCSECGFDDGFVAYNYCPNCGARMNGERDA